MKSLFSKGAFLFALIFILVLSACGGNDEGEDTASDDTSGEGESSGETYEWSIGWNTIEDSTRGVAAQEFKRIVEEESDGRITVDLFANEQLGTDNEMVESVQVGALDFQLTSSGVLAEIMPEFSASDLPFMFEDADEAHAALDGFYGDILKDKTREEGTELLNMFSIGFSKFTSIK